MKNKLNILMVSDDFYPAATGAGVHVQVISKELVKQGNHVVVITTRRRGQNREEFHQGVKVIRLPSIKIAGFYQAIPLKKSILRVLTENNIDIVHHHYISYLMIKAYSVADKLNIPQIYTYHMSAKHLCQTIFMKFFESYIFRLLVKQCNLFNYIISPSKNLVQEIKDSGVKTPIQYISNPVVFKKNESTSPIMKAAAFQILYVGRLAPEKNTPLLLHSLKLLSSKLEDFHLWVIGEGKLLKILEKLAIELGIQQKVSFLGFLPHNELAKYYLACDVFVLPSILETQGLVVMEAMRFAKPVIVTKNIVSATELVDNEQNGFIVDSDTPQMLSEKLLLLANSELLRSEMGNASLKKSKLYEVNQVIESLESVYQLNLKNQKLSL